MTAGLEIRTRLGFGSWPEDLSLGGYVGGWVLLGVLAHVIAYWAGWTLDPSDNQVLPSVSIPFWLWLCPLWSRALGRRRPPTMLEP